MKDYAMLFEKTIEKYWGHPKTPIYFSNYYGDKFEMQAILFSIIVFEINYKFEDYSDDEITVLKDYEQKCWDKKQTHQDNILILEFLSNHKNVL